MAEAAKSPEEQPKIAKVSASAKWVGGVKSINRIRNFSSFVMDEPEMLGGEDEGPNPMEYVAAALNGCVAVMASTIASEMGVKIRDIQLDTTGKIDIRGLMGMPGVKRHFQSIKQTVHIDADAAREQIESLKEQIDSRCPMINLLKDAGIEVIEDWHIHSEEAAA